MSFELSAIHSNVCSYKQNRPDTNRYGDALLRLKPGPQQSSIQISKAIVTY
jgi:hypothetical protein